MRTACIIHYRLNPCGGGERVALATMELLKEMGYKIMLITTEPTDWDKVYRLTGYRKITDKEKVMSLFNTKRFTVYQRLAHLFVISFLKLRSQCELIINTHGDAIPAPADIVYMHFPSFILETDIDLIRRYTASILWRTYYIPYIILKRAIATFNMRNRTRVMVTNSRFSAYFIRKYLKYNASIIYPPVDIDIYLPASGNMERENIIVSCGRFSSEKRYEFILDVADAMRNYMFYIIGSVVKGYSLKYYNKILELKRKRGLDNVVLLPNYPREKQVKLLSRAKVFLHAMVGEHFGIAIVEGMASGLVPVIHRSGGAWSDIIECGKYGFGYNDLEGAVEAVEQAIKDYWVLRDRVISRAKLFSKEAFKRRMKKVIEVVANDLSR